MVSGKTTIDSVYRLPPGVAGILQTSCYDCHSNHTRYPWYAELQPIGWLLSKHVKEGKRELNFSEFAAYSERRKISKLKSIAAQVRNGDMPLRSYKWLHAGGRLTGVEKQQITQWVDTLIESH